MKNRDAVQMRFTKALDIRKHKKDWLDIEGLRKRQKALADFAAFTLAHPQRLTVDKCHVCASPEWRPFGETYGVPYRECARCTHVYAYYMLTDEALADYYKQDYFGGSVFVDKSQVVQRNNVVNEPKVAYVGPFVKTARRRWLDVGTGNGAIVSCARHMGYEDAHGIELGKEAITFAKEVFDLELGNHTIDVELQKMGPKSYDIVSFFMVLEHVTDPCKQVQYARDLLSDGGLLVVEVPKADSVAALGDIAFPRNGLRQLVGAHIMNYTTKSVSHLIEENGFQIEGAWFMGQDAFNLVIHMAMLEPSFLQSKLCDFFLDNNDVLQEVIDRREMSDEIIVVARKLP
jgi:2-polyprenyl-3-methyl-5-hydroxy-6-metoxy-1,4-benzoquinol methylase